MKYFKYVCLFLSLVTIVIGFYYQVFKNTIPQGALNYALSAIWYSFYLDDKKQDKYMSTFEELWKEYPNKDGKKEAIRHFKTTVKTDADRLNVKKALLNYLQSTNVKKGFIKNGSTWFNNWQDWIDFTGAAIEEKPPSIDDIPDYKPGMTYQEFKSQVKK